MKKLMSAIGLSLLAAQSNAAQDFNAHWSFDEGVGSKISDSAKNYQSANFDNVRWMQGVHNSGALLSEKSGAKIASLKTTDKIDALTVQAWINPRNPNYAGFPNIVKKNGSFSFGLNPQKSLVFSIWANGKKLQITSKNKVWEGGNWKHVAATFDGSKLCLYVNGVLDNSVSYKTPIQIDNNSNDVLIASENGKFAFTGAIDEIEIDTRAVSACELSAAVLDGEQQIARRESRFTNFYEKNLKRDVKAVVPGTLWIDTEDFDNYGGWWMDTQFVPQMGSPYLIAAGVGKPVENAKTQITVPEAGKYKLWVRNKNWIAQGHEPGKFEVLINGKKSETTFGTGEQRAWIWQDGGTFDLSAGATSIELQDLTGYYGRCDALILTKDLEFSPKQEQADYRADRSRFVEALPTKDMGEFDVVVVGAGVAGCNAAISAARHGAKVALVQDRPMIGGGNSAELGVPVSGGSSSGRGREPGLNEEIGRVHAFNYLPKWSGGAEIVIENEPNITVFLNSHVFEAEKDSNNEITSVTSFDMLDGHLKKFSGKMFVDSTGDGWLAHHAGAQMMWGREAKETYGESNGKPIADTITMSGSLFQNSVLGYRGVNVGKPTEFPAQDWFYDLRDIGSAYPSRPNFQNTYRGGGWWTENHGRNDDFNDPEWARDDLMLVSLSYYNWVKKYSPLKEQARNFDLGFIPITNCKRETKRIVGDHILIEQDVVNRTVFPDRVGYFVWKLDVHHPLGIFSKGSPYDYETNFEPASMPFRILYSKDIPNMFMAGRNVSVTHATLGTARVQGTTGMMGQIVGTAAAMCVDKDTTPRGLYQNHIPELQQKLMKDDVTILHMKNTDPNDVARTAKATASSFIKTGVPEFVNNGRTRPLDDNMRMWKGKVPENMWISNPNEAMPQWIALDLKGEKTVNSVYLTFDTNLMIKRYTSPQMTLQDRMPPETVRDYQIQVKSGNEWKTVVDVKDNYQRRRIHRFPAEKTSAIRVNVTATNGDKSARIFEIRAYNE